MVRKMAVPGCVTWLALLGAAIVLSQARPAAADPLPDGRGYELVSAADKNGGDVMADQARVRVADDGSAVNYSSLEFFGDAIGGGIAAEYVAVRSPSVGGQGWGTRAVSPAQPALSFSAIQAGFETRYQQDLSSDVSTGVVLAWRPLTDNPFVANVTNLYLRRNLRTPGAGSYTLVSDCPLCISPFGGGSLESTPQLMATTPDFAQVVFESALNLAAGANGSGIKLYEWDETSQLVSLVGVLPDGRPALDSAAGTGHGQYGHRHAISQDGRKVFFIAEQPSGVRNVYMRLDGVSTVKLNRSEASSPDTPQSARYWDSSISGSRVFFTSPERLTDDAPATGENKLYMYDTTKADGDPHNVTFLAAAVKGVVGASADGRTVYFSDTSQLVAGLPPLTEQAAMYAWHDGEVSLVAMLPLEDEQGLQDSARKTARVSPSGDLVYLSTEPVGPNGYDHGSCPERLTRACAQVYVYRIATHELRCASCKPSGAPGGTNAQTFVAEFVGGSALTGHLSRIVTDDGRRVFFTTADALVPGDVNGKRDAYEFDTETGAVSLISSGRSTGDSYFMETTPSGDDAYFLTRERLVGWDHDDNFDLYDARVGGGFPDPTPAAPSCIGSDCHGQWAGQPAVGLAASALARSAGNVGERLKASRSGTRRCRRGAVRRKVRGRVRCVKRKPRGAHARRHAASTRRSR
jgi:hypothetical protein